ncbi:MAG: hypothetical protein QME70_04190 [Bacillota bacterium]|nr:hypothetical protein [Bacillota bacterium]
MVKVERKDGPTPAGGAYAVAVYMDDEENVVDKSVATRVVITEYDERGERLRETWAYLPSRSAGPAAV